MSNNEKIAIVIVKTVAGIFGVLAYSWIVDQFNKQQAVSNLFNTKEPTGNFTECINFWNTTDNIETIKLGFNLTVKEYCEKYN